jgi:hypothetical protein
MNVCRLFSFMGAWRRGVFAGFVATLGATFSFAEIPISIEGQSSPSLPRQYAPGSTIRFSIPSYASYSSPQWYHDDVAIPGATGSSLTIVNLTASNSGNYQVRGVSNGVADASAIQTINVLAFPPSPVDPTFQAQVPADLTPIEVFPAQPTEA